MLLLGDKFIFRFYERKSLLLTNLKEEYSYWLILLNNIIANIQNIVPWVKEVNKPTNEERVDFQTSGTSCTGR